MESIITNRLAHSLLCNRILAGLCIAAVFALSGCSPTQPPPPQTQTLSCNVPSVTAQAETKQAQEKGGLEISIAPVAYTAVHRDLVTIRQARPSEMELMIGGHADQVHVEKRTEPRLTVEPDRLRFLVKINNKMPRVFHGAGTVVQFNAGGKILAVDQRGYGSILAAIIPPRQEQQYEIIGPLLSDLADKKATVGVFMYDVVTDQSAAGVVTEKQNFEWYFDYAVAPHTESIEMAKTERGWMDRSLYQREIVREAAESGQRRGSPGGYPYPGQPVVYPPGQYPQAPQQ